MTGVCGNCVHWIETGECANNGARKGVCEIDEAKKVVQEWNSCGKIIERANDECIED